MTTQRQYWVLSPNVKRDERTVSDWKTLIIRTHAAIMGWPPKQRFGRRFANDLQVGDIILIARRHNWEPDVVGFGVVKGKCKEKLFRRLLDEPVYVRKLSPFISIKQRSKDVPFTSVLIDNKSFRQLYPDPEKKDPTWQVCQWMERQLKEQGSDANTALERNLPKSNTYGYKVKTKGQVTEARKREKKLLDDYERWLEKQGRHLSELPYGRLRCDAWEKERQNLIEAKGSTSREDIRMAVGQLFDYSFQGKEKYKQPNMAILLPKKPSPKSVEWLEPVGIKIIWRRGWSFLDNANRQFT